MDKAAREHKDVTGIEGGGVVVIGGVNKANDEGTGNHKKEFGGTGVGVGRQEAGWPEVNAGEREALGGEGGKGGGGGRGDGDARDGEGGGGGPLQD